MHARTQQQVGQSKAKQQNPPALYDRVLHVEALPPYLAPDALELELEGDLHDAVRHPAQKGAGEWTGPEAGSGLPSGGSRQDAGVAAGPPVCLPPGGSDVDALRQDVERLGTDGTHNNKEA